MILALYMSTGYWLVILQFSTEYRVCYDSAYTCHGRVLQICTNEPWHLILNVCTCRANKGNLCPILLGERAFGCICLCVCGLQSFGENETIIQSVLPRWLICSSVGNLFWLGLGIWSCIRAYGSSALVFSFGTDILCRCGHLCPPVQCILHLYKQMIFRTNAFQVFFTILEALIPHHAKTGLKVIVTSCIGGRGNVFGSTLVSVCLSMT